MKKLLLLALLILSLSILSACGGSDSTPEGDKDDPPVIDETKYTISFVDENGTVISTQSVTEGTVPSFTYAPNDTAEWDYTFVGWSESEGGDTLSAIPEATCDKTYYAIVSSEKQRYTVVFNTMGGSSIGSVTVAYGDLVNEPEKPKLDGHKFVCWSTDKDGKDPVDFSKSVHGNVEYYAIWNKTVDIKALLKTLLGGYKLDPLSYIPDTMKPAYSQNLVSINNTSPDYTGFVRVSDITLGFGEQWNMVIENIEQSEIFFNVLSVVDTLSSLSMTAFNNYFDQNPDDTAHHEFSEGIYGVAIDFDGKVISYVLEYNANLPVLGQQTAQIALAMDITTGVKTVRVQLGDANALIYNVSDTAYTFAIKYLGTRRAMFSISRDKSGNVSGSIYEFLTLSDISLSSAAEFIITEDYVSVVGNKASGMVLSTDYITELYSTKTGDLLGYEVEEKLLGLTYNTLWFNLSDIDGLSSIKYIPENGNTPAAIYLNGSGTAFKSVNVGGLSFKNKSRRFDIEFRTQYVYSYDSTSGEYIKTAVSVPMLFIQEEVYDDFENDMKESNGITLSVGVSDKNLEKLLTDYDSLIPLFIERKDLITPDVIIEMIGDRIVFN